VLVPADLRVLASKFHPVRYRRGEVIFREGETAERLFLIGEGRVKLTTASSAGQELLIGVLGKGQIFGELEVIDHGPRAMDARASANRLISSFAGRGWIDWNDGYPLVLLPEALMRRAR